MRSPDFPADILLPAVEPRRGLTSRLQTPMMAKAADRPHRRGRPRLRQEAIEKQQTIIEGEATGGQHGKEGVGEIGNSKTWFDSYPDGMPHEIGELEFPSVAALIEHACRTYAARDAFSCMGKSITYADLQGRSAQIGAWLLSKGCRRAIAWRS